MKVRHVFILSSCLSAGVMHADPVLITNPGFEDITGESPFNEFTFGPLNGWSLYDPNNITDGGDGPNYYIGTLTPQPDPGSPGNFINFPGGASEGNRVGIAFNYQPTGGQGEYGFSQTLSSALIPNTMYTLLVDIGNIASGMAVSGDFFELSGFPGYRVDLLAGGVVLASDNNTLAGSIADGAWGTSSVTFQTGASHAQLGQNLSIRLVNLNTVDSGFPGSDLEVDFDNVRLDASPIPEPGSALLLALGFTAMCWRRCRARA